MNPLDGKRLSLRRVLELTLVAACLAVAGMLAFLPSYSVELDFLGLLCIATLFVCVGGFLSLLVVHVRGRRATLTDRAAVLGTACGVIAHEINQALGAILGDAEAGLRLLESRDSSVNDVREILRDIIASDLRATKVIKRVSDLLRDGEVRRASHQLNELAAEVLKLMRGELTRHGVAVELQLQPDLPPVQADRIQIEQVLVNLVVNACEAMRETPLSSRVLTVTTRSGRHRGEVELAIADSGQGVAHKDRERIFEPFVTEKPEGLGLGLAICRAIVRAHAGRLWAEAGERGAIFRMTLCAAGSAAGGRGIQNEATTKRRAPP